jgi:hypothetical protein
MNLITATEYTIAIYVTSDRKRAFYDPLTHQRRKFSSTRKIFADLDSEMEHVQIFFLCWKISTSGSGSLNAAFSITSDTAFYLLVEVFISAFAINLIVFGLLFIIFSKTLEA